MRGKIILFLLGLSMFIFSEPLRRISVTGNIEQEIMPDMAKMSFMVYTKNESLEKAGTENKSNLEAFKNELKKKKIVVTTMEVVSQYSNKIVENATVPQKRTEYETGLYFTIRVDDYDKIPDIIGILEKGSIKRLEKNSDYRKKNNIYFLQIVRKNPDKETSVSEAFNLYDSFKNELQSVGIDTSSISIYSYQNKKNEIQENVSVPKTYYNVYSLVSFETKNLKQINDIIDAAEKNKVNLQGAIAFDLSNRKAVETDLYNKAYQQTKDKAKSILKSSSMALGDPLVVSESVSYQYKAIAETENYIAAPVVAAKMDISADMGDMEMRKEFSGTKVPAPKKVDYKPQLIKVTQDVSVLYEIK